MKAIDPGTIPFMKNRKVRQAQKLQTCVLSIEKNKHGQHTLNNGTITNFLVSVMKKDTA